MLRKAAALAPALRTLLSTDTQKVNLRFCSESVECGKSLLTLEDNLSDEALTEKVRAFVAANGIPHAVTVQGLGTFPVTPNTKTGRLAGKVAIVTGGAQGFGKGIASFMNAEGAYVVIADMNEEGAKATASEFEGAIAVKANVSDEASVENLMCQTVLAFGGIDVLVSNAGIVRAGSLEEMTKANFELVTAVNYTGYFLCTKYASAVMKIQHRFAPERLYDIIEINSKSGLAGSNKNFAYAGSKFGGIGLTQSFAMELAPYNIKVNAVCPGNYLEGPLWTDPERGLLVQYLNAGKVPGAKTVEDVLRFYESKVPLNRGCRPLDVARAIFYVCEQDYETGQAIPVTGGQEMLK
ncbi:MAG: SDR family oxidoreductase [Ruminococcaceae bacterium]|nr:SDR family oxidoreductase [Oscillospiraceae bacterium]